MTTYHSLASLQIHAIVVFICPGIYLNLINWGHRIFCLQLNCATWIPFSRKVFKTLSWWILEIGIIAFSEEFLSGPVDFTLQSAPLNVEIKELGFALLWPQVLFELTHMRRMMLLYNLASLLLYFIILYAAWNWMCTMLLLNYQSWLLFKFINCIVLALISASMV